jgi:hypothetical protein
MFTKILIANRGDAQRGRAVIPTPRITRGACDRDPAAETSRVQ